MMQSNIKIAITGGIGSGKSTVSRFIEDSGFAVVSCDKIYSELLNGGVFCDDFSAAFGDKVFTDGKVDKAKLANLVFNDFSCLKKLNEITHPKIIEEAFKRVGNKKIGFVEVPLLFENGFEKYFDKVIVVLRDRDSRIASIVERDKISENEAILRINSQINYDISDFTKYYVIHNNGIFCALRETVDTLLKKIVEIF